MSPAALTGTIPDVPAAVVADAWQVYRRSQEVAFGLDGAADLMLAQDRLFSLADPKSSGRVPVSETDLPAVEDAIDALVAAVEWHCGAVAAAYVSGERSAP